MNYPLLFQSEGEHTLHITGPVGELELLIKGSDEGKKVVAIICHPHPLFQGTMHNKVVTTLARCCHDLTIASVRFNFRGVGLSQGEYAHGLGEIDDLLAVVTWVKQQLPEYDIWLMGFSFGGYVAARGAMLLPETKCLVTVAPAVENFPMHEIKNIQCPWVVIQGDQDDTVATSAVLAWHKTVKPRPELLLLEGVGHFFHGRLVELRERLVQTLQEQTVS